MVYWMLGFRLLNHSKTANEKVALFLSLTGYDDNTPFIGNVVSLLMGIYCVKHVESRDWLVLT